MSDPQMTEQYYLDYEGHCEVCDKTSRYVNRYSIGHRGQMGCVGCPIGSVPRERALAWVLKKLYPNWREFAIHESSPAKRGISVVMQNEAPGYIGSHYFPTVPMGETVDGWRNENLEKQTFADGVFDLVVSLDVFEHIFDPAAATREIYRTLRPGGAHVCTFPIWKEKTEPYVLRATLAEDGTVQHLLPAEYHGNPIDVSGGVLVTHDYGYDIHKSIAEWAPFDVTIMRMANKTAGILGEFTDVIVCEKPLSVV